jgi:putative heme-binding domain-containing protein
VRAAAIAALARLDLHAAAQLASIALSETPNPVVIEEVLTAFVVRKGGLAELVQALGARPPSKSTAEAGLQVLSAGGQQDSPLTSILRQAAGLGPRTQKITLDQVGALSAEVRAAGDAKRGDEIFHRPQLGCVACHAISGKGGDIGPDLGSLGSAQPVDFIIGAILEPQKEVKEGYMSTLVTTVDGEEYQGYLVGETREELVLRDILQRKLVRFPRKSIKEQRQNGSAMPSGLVEGLSRAEFCDLVRYLSELGRNK